MKSDLKMMVKKEYSYLPKMTKEDRYGTIIKTIKT